MIKTTKQKGEFGMKRTVYEAPVTELFRVELEGTFMSASAEVTNGSQNNLGIEDHDVNTDFSADFSNGSWD